MMDTTATHNSNQTIGAQAHAATAAHDELPISMNAMAALSYAITPVAVGALLMRDYQKNAHVRFAATQSLVLMGSVMVAYIVIGVVLGLFSAMVGAILGSLSLYSLRAIVSMIPTFASLLLSLGTLGTVVALIVTASQGKKLKLPIIGEFAERFASR